MIERGLDISTADGAMNRWTVRPDDCGPLPVVIMLMDAPGVRDGLKEICRRIAQSGYYVLLPNLYCRTTRAFVLGQTRDHADAQAFLERMFGMVGSISNDKIAADTGAALERLHERPIRHRGGGEACRPDRLLCVLLWNAPDHRQAGLAAPPVGRHHGRRGPTHSPSTIPTCRLTRSPRSRNCWRLRHSRREGEIEKGTHHGYAFSDRDNFNEAAREKHYERMLALHRRHIG